jgi:hypothetical protein
MQDMRRNRPPPETAQPCSLNTLSSHTQRCVPTLLLLRALLAPPRAPKCPHLDGGPLVVLIILAVSCHPPPCPPHPLPRAPVPSLAVFTLMEDRLSFLSLSSFMVADSYT